MGVKNLQQISMSQFSRGRNGKDDPTMFLNSDGTATGECTEQINIRTVRNEIENRPGERKLGSIISSTLAINGIGKWENNIISSHQGNLYINTTDNFIFQNSLDLNASVSFLEYYNDLYISNGINTPLRAVRSDLNGNVLAGASTIVLDDASKFIEIVPSGKQVFTTKTGFIDGDAFTYGGVSAGTILARTFANSPYTTTLVETTINYDASGGNSTVIPITAVGNTNKVYIIRKTDATANTVIINPFGAQTIDGVTTVTLTNQYDYVIIRSNGANWVTTTHTFAGSTILDLVTGVLAHNDNGIVITTFSLSTVPKGKAMAEFGEKMWVANVLATNAVPTDPWRLNYSVTANAGTPANFYDFASLGSGQEFLAHGKEIKALLNYRETLLIGKKDGILQVSGFSSDATPQPIIEDFFKKDGPINEDCMILVNKDVVFFTGKRIQKLSRPDIDNLRLEEGFDRPVLDILEEIDSDQSEAAMGYNISSGLLFLAVKSKGASRNDLVIVYNTDTGAWWKEINTFARKFVELNGIMYYAHSVTGKVIQDNIGTTKDGAPDITFYESRHIKPSIPNRVEWRHLYLDGRITENTCITVKEYVDGNLINTADICEDDIVESQSSFGSQALGDSTVGDSVIGDAESSETFGSLSDETDIRKRFEKVIPIGRNGKVFYYTLETSGNTQLFKIQNAAVNMVPLSEAYRLQASN